MVRSVLEISNCLKTFEGDGIPVTRAFPIPGLREFDPFLLFDHFGPISYEPGNGTGVPAHPHCGFEAITYLLEGEIEHKDSWGGKATIQKGDVQWMTTGSGLIHSELITEKFKKSGGLMHGLQIWVNLPQKNKKAKPGYQHILKKDIPTIELSDNIFFKVLVGNVMNFESIVNTHSPVSIFEIQFTKPGKIVFDVPKDQIAMAYIIAGEIQFIEMNKIASKGQMIYFDQASDSIDITSISSYGSYLIMAGKALNEPIARHGPFVANSEAEIKQALRDYENGEMGKLE